MIIHASHALPYGIGYDTSLESGCDVTVMVEMIYMHG